LTLRDLFCHYDTKLSQKFTYKYFWYLHTQTNWPFRNVCLTIEFVDTHVIFIIILCKKRFKIRSNQKTMKCSRSIDRHVAPLDRIVLTLRANQSWFWLLTAKYTLIW
jgi:hypothetical protein